MIQSLKLKVLALISALFSLLLKFKGVTLGERCTILGKPRIFRKRGGKIILGNNVTLISCPRYNTIIEHPVNLTTHNPDSIIQLDDHVGISGCTLITDNKISVGEYTIIGPGTLLFDVAAHEYSPDIGWGKRCLSLSQSISIGKKCYIGTRCIILTGVTIGDNCVVAAGCVVDKSIPAGHLAAGNPMVIKPLPKLLGGAGKRAAAGKSA